MTALMITNTDKVTRFNFIRVKNIFEKRWLDNGQNTVNVVNLQKWCFAVEVNFTKKTVTVNGCTYAINEYTGWTYRVQRNAIDVQTVKSFARHLQDAASDDNIFHYITADLLRKLAKNKLKP